MADQGSAGMTPAPVAESAPIPRHLRDTRKALMRRRKNRFLTEGRCWHCGKPCAPYRECAERLAMVAARRRRGARANATRPRITSRFKYPPEFAACQDAINELTVAAQLQRKPR